MRSKIATKKGLIEFVRSEVSKGRYPGRVELEKRFHIDLRSYFSNSIVEVYENIGVDYGIVKEKIVRNRIRLAMRKRRRFHNKMEGRKSICEFIKQCVRNDIYPGVRDVESKFNIRIRSYFRNGIREAYNLSGLEFPARASMPDSVKENKKKEIENFVKFRIEEGIFPGRLDIERGLKLDLRYYFSGGMAEIFRNSGIKNSEIRKAKRKLPNKQRKFPIIEVGKEAIAEFIKEQSTTGYFPVKEEIEKRFSINLKSYFSSIGEAYTFAGVKKPLAVRQLMLDKERKLTRVVVNLLPKLGYKIIQINALPFKEKAEGADIIAKDNEGNIIPIELKAYHRNSYLPNNIKKLSYENEFSQVMRYIDNLKAKYGIIITTTDRIKKRVKPPSNIKVINGSQLTKLLEENEMESHKPAITWIRNTHATADKRKYIEKGRREIIDFVKWGSRSGKTPTVREINQNLGLDTRTYFSGGIEEIYTEAGKTDSKIL